MKTDPLVVDFDTPVAGQYVYVQNKQGSFMTLCEVEVYSPVETG